MHKAAFSRFVFFVILLLFISLVASAVINKIAFCRQESSVDWDIWIMNRDGSGQQCLLNSTAKDMNPHFSPDGTKIVFTRTTGTVPNIRNDAYIMNADGTGAVNLTSSLTYGAAGPKFSWDGTKITYFSSSPTGSVLGIMNADGTNKHEVKDQNNVAVQGVSPFFTPNGQWIVFQRIIGNPGDKQSKICKVPAAGGTVIDLTLASDFDELPRVSPDGNYIIYKHYDLPEIYRIPINHTPGDSATMVNLTNTNTAADDSPMYSYEGDAIAYMVGTTGLPSTEIWIMNTDGSGKTRLTSNSVADFDPTFSPGEPENQPDLQIKGANDAELIGGGIYNNIALQTSEVTTVGNAPFQLLLGNRGAVADTVILTGTAGTGGWTVKYYDGRPTGDEITAQVTDSGGWQVDLPAGENIPVWIGVDAAGGVFDVTVNMKSAIRPDLTDSVMAKIIMLPLTDILMAATYMSPVAIGREVQFTGTTVGGGLAEYRLIVGTVVNGITTYPESLPDFQLSNIMTWTPLSAGTYKVTGQARERGTSNIVTSEEMLYTVTDVLSAVNLSISPASPMPQGQTVTLTATAVGGANNQYKFMNGTITIRNFTSSNYCTWTPAMVKTYDNIRVITRDSNGANPYTEVVSPAKTIVTTNTLSAVRLTTSPSGDVLFGKMITLTAYATGGASVQYKFMNGTTVIRNYSAVNTCTWTPAMVKIYDNITVVAKDVNGIDPNATVTSAPVSITTKPALTAARVAVSPGSVVGYGTQVTLTASTTGGVKPQFKFMNGAVIIRDFAASNTCTWIPATVKTYTAITVVVKDLGGNDPAATITSPAISLTVKPSLSAAVLTASLPSPNIVNRSVLLTAAATGGATQRYCYLDGETILQDFSAVTTYNWTPAATGTHNLTVQVKDITGADPNAVKISTPLIYVVAEPLTAVSLQSSSYNIVKGAAITLTATPIGGANTQYKFMNGTVTIRDFAAGNTCAWTPAMVKTYSNITVTAKDINGVNPAATVTSAPISIVVTAD